MKKSLGIYGKRIMLLVLALCLVLIAACTNKDSHSDSDPAKSTGNAATATAASSSSSAENTDPLGKYDPPITLSTVKIFNSSVKFAPGETPENNIWTDGYKKDLGIEMKIDWSVVGSEPGGAGEQKLNISIASKDLPDIIPVNAKQFKQLVDNDMVEDLTDVYAKYASPLLKKFYSANNGLALEMATFKGKLLALPIAGASVDSAAMIWIRKDWLDKLQLPEPKSMADILNISDAFTNLDPDGNDKQDTFGLGVDKNLYSSRIYDVSGFMEGYHAYRNIWLKDESGKLAYSGIQPEMKIALSKLQEMFQGGQIDPEFGVKDSTKVNESVVAGKIGMFYGAHWNAFLPLPDAFKQDPNAVWKPYPIVSVDEKPANPTLGLGVNPDSVEKGFIAFKKGSKHPEALIKLANYYAAKEYGWDTGSVDLNYHQPVPNPDGYTRWSFAAVIALDPNQNINIYRGVRAAVEDNDMSGLKNLQAKDNYDNYMKYVNGDMTQYGTKLWSGPKDSALSIFDYYLNHNLGITNQFYGSKTETMVKKQSTLDKLQLETFTKIVMGAAPVDEFDQFVTNWRKLGGDEITKEVNDWYEANKK